MSYDGEDRREITKEQKEQNKKLADLEKELASIKEYIHFPPDYGPVDHVSYHIEAKIRKKNNAELFQAMKKWLLILVLTTMVTIFGLGLDKWLGIN